MKARAQSSGSPVRSRTRRIVASSSLFAGAVLLGAALALAPGPAVAEDAPCSDTSPDDGECTATEEFAYCLTDVFATYADCLEDAGLLKRLTCGLEYELATLKCLGEIATSLLK